MIFPILILLSALVCQARSQDDLWQTDESDELQQRDRRTVNGDVLDIHNGEYCVNVSSYVPDIVWKTIIKPKCYNELEKNCTTRTETVCAEVTEIACEVVPYTKCEMKCDKQLLNSSWIIKKDFHYHNCMERFVYHKHKKNFPVCQNVTKQNCVSKWETDENGNQVWAGNEDCEPVTWQDCKIEHRYVDFRVPVVNCTLGKYIPYMFIEEKPLVQTLTHMECKVEHTVECKPNTTSRCKDIQFEECWQFAKPNCVDIEIIVPYQEFSHKKKCLLAGGESLPDLESLNPREHIPYQGADIVHEYVTPSTPAIRPVNIFEAINRADGTNNTPGQVRDKKETDAETFDSLNVDSEYGKRKVEVAAKNKGQ